MSTLNYFREVLGVGKVKHVQRASRNDTALYTVNLTDLINTIVPLFVYHQITFLTSTRRHQYNRLLYVIENGIKNYDDLPENPPISQYLFLNEIVPSNYLAISFFDSWIVGFIMADGSFSYTENMKSANFSIKQRTQQGLLEAILLRLGSSRNLTIIPEIGNWQERQLLMVSSITDIQAVINFFSFSDVHPLIGDKAESYKRWLIALRDSSRYGSLNFPPID